jgi:hypothetical protein
MRTEPPTVGPIERFMVAEHVRIDRLLEAATLGADIDLELYARFRHELLRHIAMEEKVLLPFARERRGGDPLHIAALLRADHGEIAKLLVRSPTSATVDTIRAILARHNPLEEGPRGLYALCDTLAGDEASLVLARLCAQPTVPVAPYYTGPIHPRA